MRHQDVHIGGQRSSASGAALEWYTKKVQATTAARTHQNAITEHRRGAATLLVVALYKQFCCVWALLEPPCEVPKIVATALAVTPVGGPIATVDEDVAGRHKQALFEAVSVAHRHDADDTLPHRWKTRGHTGGHGRKHNTTRRSQDRKCKESSAAVCD